MTFQPRIGPGPRVKTAFAGAKCANCRFKSWDNVDECGKAAHVEGEGIAVAVAVAVQGWVDHLCAYDNRVHFGDATNH
jgi:hypothetical protein